MSETLAESVFKDNFQNSEKWNFVTDQVMGGVSSGNVEFIPLKNNFVAHITGKISTQNRGGFIQIRRKLNKVNLENSKFINITAKGNNQKYFIHLRVFSTTSVFLLLYLLFCSSLRQQFHLITKL